MHIVISANLKFANQNLSASQWLSQMMALSISLISGVDLGRGEEALQGFPGVAGQPPALGTHYHSALAEPAG